MRILTSALVALVVACGAPAVAAAAPTPDWWLGAMALLQTQPGAQCVNADFAQTKNITECSVATGRYANSRCTGDFVGDLTPATPQREPDLYYCAIWDAKFDSRCARGDDLTGSGQDIVGEWRRDYDRAFLPTLTECLSDPRIALVDVGKSVKLKVVRGAIVVPLRVYRRASCDIRVSIRIMTKPKTFRDFKQRAKKTYKPGHRRARLPIKAATVKALRGRGRKAVSLFSQCTARRGTAGSHGEGRPVPGLVLPKAR